MKRLLKKFFAYIMTFMMIFSLISVGTYAEETSDNEIEIVDEMMEDETSDDSTDMTEEDGIIDSGTCGNDLTWTLDADGLLSISGTGDMDNYTNVYEYGGTDYELIPTPWYGYEDAIKTVKINNGVTSIGEFAFSYFTAISDIYISSDVVYIGQCAFSGCTSLESITIPDSVISIGECAFSGCTSLTSINLPNSLTYIERGLVWGCNNLTAIDIPKSVTTIGEYAFDNCIALTNIVIPESVTDIEKNAFSYCSSLSDITIPNSVINIGESAFEGCTSLTSITIPKNVQNIGQQAFGWCSNLTEIYFLGDAPEIAKYTIEGTSGGYGAFADVTATAYYSGDNDTYTHDVLQAESYGGYLTWVVVYDSSIIAYGTTSGLSWTLNVEGTLKIRGEGDMGYYGEEEPAPWTDYTDDILNVVIEDGVTNIGNRAFYECSALTNITIPESVTCIENYAFNGCTSLTNVAIPDSVTSIGWGSFYGCTSLTDISLSNNLTSIGVIAFEECTSLTNVTIPDSVITIGNSAFYKCTSLTNIIISDSITSMGRYTFYGCSSLTNITLSNNLTAIEEYTFYNCSSLTDITIPDSVTAIEKCAFVGCTSLTNIIIPDSVTSIGDSTFNGCSSLTNITLSNNLTTIENRTFNGCSSLINIIIPDSVTTIESRAFYNCTNLSSVVIPVSVTTIGSSAFSGSDSLTAYYDGCLVEWEKIGYSDGFSNGIEYNNSCLLKEVNSEATCENRGYVTYTCSKTGSTYSVYTNSLGHCYDDGSLTAATTKSNGSIIYTCSRCGSTTIEKIYKISEIKLSETDYIYDGNPKEPLVTVLDSNGDTIDNSYYDITYENNVSSGTATVTITFKGRYSGTETDTFTINPIDLSDFTATLSTTSYTYNGSAKKPNITVNDGETTLTSGTDYTVSYSNNTNAGTATVIITGIGNYTGTITKTFTINKASYTPTVNAYSGTYDAKSHTITISGVKSGSTIKYKTTSSGTYSTTKPTRTSAGTTTVYYQITNDNYKTITGSAKITISARKVSSLSISLSTTTYTYDGKVKKPSVTVKYNGTTISSSNYTVTYASGRKNVGTYKVTIKAKSSNLTGSITKTFKINPPKTSISSLTKASKAFTVKWTKKTTQVTGYQIQYSTSSSFSSSTTKTIMSNKTTSKKITGLKSKKKYYVRIRTYKTVSGTKYYSSWSSVKSVTTK